MTPSPAAYSQRRLVGILAVVDLQLANWGRWAKQYEAGGWPSLTLLGRLMKEGPTGAAHGTRPPIAMPEDIARVDTGVARLAPILRRVVYVQYVEAAHLPRELKARKCGMRESRYSKKLESARYAMAALLDCQAPGEK
jgi:hypothetical protein